jgi:hypothetical protein
MLVERDASQYLFISISTTGVGGEGGTNVGVTLLRDEGKSDEEIKERLLAIPEVAAAGETRELHVLAFHLDAEQAAFEGLEVGRFYTREEAVRAGYLPQDC